MLLYERYFNVATKIIMHITENMMECENHKNERNVEEKMLGFISHLKKYQNHLMATAVHQAQTYAK